MKQIWIFRHGETDWNREERFQGHTDIPLNDRGREQARALIDPLRTGQVEVILSSDLSRAHETGEIIARALGIIVQKDQRLREAHLGKAQGMTRLEIEAEFGVELANRWRSPHLTDADVSYPGGESGTAIAERVFQALEEFLKSTPYQQIGVATHGGVIRRVMQRILPPGSPTVAIPNGVVYCLSFDPSTGLWSY